MSKKNLNTEEVQDSVQTDVLAEEMKPEEPKTRKAEKPKSVEVKGPVVYVGPTIVGKISGNTTFKNGIPKIAEEIIQKYPYFKNLFVSIDGIAAAKKQLADKKSALAVFFDKAKTI